MKKNIHKILACVDLSQYSLTTLGYAVELADGTDAQIVVLNVINQADISGVEMISGYYPGYFSVSLNAEDYIRDLKKERHESLKQLIVENFFDDKSKMSIKVVTGDPSEKILETVETQDIDLVVMSNKGRGNISRFLFGSTAEKVFRHSPVPVTSVREQEKFKYSNRKEHSY